MTDSSLGEYIGTFESFELMTPEAGDMVRLSKLVIDNDEVYMYEISIGHLSERGR